MRIDPLDFSQPRLAPESVVRALEALDPTACLVHLGGAKWLVGKVRPNRLVTAEAGAMVDHWAAAIRRALAARAEQATVQALRRRAVESLRFAELALLGVRTVGIYDVTTEMDFGRLVEDFRRSRWLWLHAPADEPLAAQDRADAAIKAANAADLTDPGRARDAWRYAFTRSHAPGISLTPADRVRAGMVRHPRSA